LVEKRVIGSYSVNFPALGTSTRETGVSFWPGLNIVEENDGPEYVGFYEP
jgi:hypothetical protein